MLKITQDIGLSEIKLKDSDVLFELMSIIYPPAYEHLWIDNGKEYINKIYSKENLEVELKNVNSKYYFVLFNKIRVGIIKIILSEPIDSSIKGFGIKLHRIYLHPSIQGKGIGQKLINWIENEFCKFHNSYLWLEVMDTQKNAISFYERQGFSIVSTFKFNSNKMKDNLRGMYKMKKDISSN